MKKKLFAGLLAGLLLVTACGSSASDSVRDYNKSASSVAASYSNGMAEYAAESGYYAEESAPLMKADAGSGSTSREEPKADKENDSARKRIVTYTLSVETEEFEGLLASLEARVESFGGYFESIDTYNGSKYGYDYRDSRHSSIKVRVPAKRADEFVQFVGDSANITNKSLSSEDVTLSYVDTQSKRDTYKIEMERLLAMLEKAETTEDMLAIEDRLTDVRYRLESMESQLRTYDNLVDYTAIYLYVDEVKQYTPPKPESYFERLGRAFTDGWESFVEWLQDLTIAFAESLPGWILFAVIVVVIVLVIKHFIKKKGLKGRRRQPAPGTPAYPASSVAQNVPNTTASAEANKQDNNGKQ